MPETKEKNPAAVALGRIKTPLKQETALRNLSQRSPDKLGGREPVPLSEIECAIKASKAAGSPCPGGDSLTGHHWSCPRGQAIKRRQAEGRDVQTGLKPDA